MRTTTSSSLIRRVIFDHATEAAGLPTRPDAVGLYHRTHGFGPKCDTETTLCCFDRVRLRSLGQECRGKRTETRQVATTVALDGK